MIEGAFITVVPGKFGFIAPEGYDLGNVYVTAGTLAGLPRVPHRGGGRSGWCRHMGSRSIEPPAKVPKFTISYQI